MLYEGIVKLYQNNIEINNSKYFRYFIQYLDKFINLF
jgi:hypothetical protein